MAKSARTGRAKKSDAYITWYVGDYLRDTLHLTMRQHGGYSMLLWAAYSSGGAISEARCRIVTRLDDAAWAEDRATLAEFFEVRDGVWWHPRVLRELEKRGQISAARSAAGFAGNAAKATQTGTQSDRKSAPPAPSPTPPPNRREQQDGSNSLPGASETGSGGAVLLAEWILGMFNSPNLLRVDEIRVWRQMGAEDALIMDVLRSISERETSANSAWKPSTLRYFTPAIEQALKTRKTEEEVLDRQINEVWRTWEPRVRGYREHGRWLDEWEGKPDSERPNPAIPAELLGKYEFKKRDAA
jgi:uncharacterized protein YdaU (DUF1376 family)